MDPNDLELEDFAIESLGPLDVPSPLQRRRQRFVDERDRVLLFARTSQVDAWRARRAGAEADLPSFESAGARSRIHFDPSSIACGIVSCGGLCPGINNVIRSIVLTATWGYGVREIYGFRYGFAGVADDPAAGPPLRLHTEMVEPIHEEGGSLLGSSRGPQDPAVMVDHLERLGVRILFTIGGDGTLRGASALAAEIRRRGLDIAVVGIPKTIDNDIAFIERSFGFATAVEEARQAIVGAHTEARGALNGIGLVKLMGRHSGFITAHASLANSDVNFCLVPEVPFALGGPGGFLEALETRLRDRQHAVIVVAEGAAQEWMQQRAERQGGLLDTDPSGNVRLHDVGPFLKKAIRQYLDERGLRHTVKYIDPSYMVRSMPANSTDAKYGLELGQHAVHAGMAGRTDLVVGSWSQSFTHVPIRLAVAERKRLDPDGPVWHRVLEATGQPADMLGAVAENMAGSTITRPDPATDPKPGTHGAASGPT